MIGKTNEKYIEENCSKIKKIPFLHEMTLTFYLFTRLLTDRREIFDKHPMCFPKSV